MCNKYLVVQQYFETTKMLQKRAVLKLVVNYNPKLLLLKIIFPVLKANITGKICTKVYGNFLDLDCARNWLKSAN